MSVKFITSIYSDLYGTEFGGRPNRGGHYRYSLLSLLKMTDADFLCYTSDRELPVSFIGGGMKISLTIITIGLMQDYHIVV